MTIPDYHLHCDASCVVMAQMEDASALDHLDEIVAIEGIDMLFIGPADLAQSTQIAYHSEELDEAILRIVAAGLKPDKAIGLFVVNAAHISDWKAKRVTLFVCDSDQSMLKTAAIAAVTGKRSCNAHIFGWTMYVQGMGSDGGCAPKTPVAASGRIQFVFFLQCLPLIQAGEDVASRRSTPRCAVPSDLVAV